MTTPAPRRSHPHKQTQTAPPAAKNPVHAAGDLRRRAEQRMAERSANKEHPRTDADTQRFLHELQVHHIELEMQNEALQQARDEVEAGLEKYSDLFDFAPIGYVTLNRDGSIREANLAAAALLGLERSSLLERRFTLHVIPRDRADFSAWLERLAQEGAREVFETTLVPEGAPAVAVRLEAALAASGEEYRVAVMDLIERNRAEEERLIRSKLESTGVLAGGIAHDFNNLFTVVMLDFEEARALAVPGGELARRLEAVAAAVRAARELTQRLLAFAPGSRLERKPARLDELIRTVARATVHDPRVACKLLLAPDLWLAEVDEGQIAQVIRNLILNAQESMPDGGAISLYAENVVLTGGTDPPLAPGDYVRVSIADEGTGILPEVLPKIFDPYFSTKRPGTVKGLGLGLTICQAVVRKHGGTLSVETTVQRGTTFRIHLPASRDLTVPSAPATTAHLARSLRVLVMDDEKSLRRAVDSTLRRMGHEVEVVDGWEQAIEAYRISLSWGCPFDLVLLDPSDHSGPGGQTTMEALRTIDPQVRAIVMTGDPSNPVVHDPARFGFKGALLKPFDASALEEIVLRVIAS